MTDYYGIFHPESEDPIGQIFSDEEDAHLELARWREVVDATSSVPIAGAPVEALYAPVVAALYVDMVG